MAEENILVPEWIDSDTKLSRENQRSYQPLLGLEEWS